MSTTSSTLTSVLSALGGSNGIDVTSAVNAILYADRAPERGWQTQQTALSAQTSAINQIQTEASSLSDALNALNTFQGVLSAATTTTSNSNVVTATAADGASSGSHLITVTNLAATGSWYSGRSDQQLRHPALRQLSDHRRQRQPGHHQRRLRLHQQHPR